MRSPIVIRNLLSATVGCASTRASSSFTGASSFSSACASGRDFTSRCMRGGLPNSTSIGMSMGALPNCRSVSFSACSSVASPSTAKGARSRSQRASKRDRSSGAMAST